MTSFFPFIVNYYLLYLGKVKKKRRKLLFYINVKYSNVIENVIVSNQPPIYVHICTYVEWSGEKPCFIQFTLSAWIEYNSTNSYPLSGCKRRCGYDGVDGDVMGMSVFGFSWHQVNCGRAIWKFHKKFMY